MSCVDDEYVVCAGVLYQVALLVSGAGSPVASECADLLCDRQVARSVEGKHLVCSIGRGHGEFRTRDGVCLGRLDGAVQLFLDALGDEGQPIQGLLMALRWERIVGHIVSPLGQGQVALDDDSHAACRRCAECHIAAAVSAGTRYCVVGGQRLDGFCTVRRALNHAQISVCKNLERIGEDRGGAIARIAHLCRGARYGHRYPSSISRLMSTAASPSRANSGSAVSSRNASSMKSSCRLWIIVRRRPLSALR